MQLHPKTATPTARPPATPALIRLPFERALLLESHSCERCAGTGRVAFAATCYNCNGLARTLTPLGAEVFRSVCGLLGIEPKIDKRRRVDPHFMRTMFASQVRAGMAVRPSLNQIPAPPFKLVVDAHELRDGCFLITYAGGAAVNATAYTMFARELTEDELGRADHWLAQHIGQGAEEVSDGR